MHVLFLSLLACNLGFFFVFCCFSHVCVGLPSWAAGNWWAVFLTGSPPCFFEDDDDATTTMTMMMIYRLINMIDWSIYRLTFIDCLITKSRWSNRLPMLSSLVISSWSGPRTGAVLGMVGRGSTAAPVFINCSVFCRFAFCNLCLYICCILCEKNWELCAKHYHVSLLFISVSLSAHGAVLFCTQMGSLFARCSGR